MKSVLFILFSFLIQIQFVTASDNPLWISRYNGASNGIDEARSMAVDNTGNVYVTGRSQGLTSNYDFITIKYNSNGDTVWIKIFNGLGNSVDEATDIAIDNLGNVYVTGFSTNTSLNSDYTTIKYSSSGELLWVKLYNGPGNFDDNSYSLALDDEANVYVTGRSPGIGTGADYATIKYHSNGNQEWITRYNGLGNDADISYSVTCKGSFVYVTGMSRGIFGSSVSGDYVTIKYSTVGDSVWVKRCNGAGNNYDEPCAVVTDNAGNIYVTGFSWNISDPQSADYLTVKYNTAGDSLWVKRYNGPGNSRDEANGIAVDAAGNVYVTGVSAGTVTGYDYGTVKYSSSGAQQWVARYNGTPPTGYDEATAVALDNSGNVYVTGFSAVITGTGDFATIRYNPAGVQQWLHRYNGPGNNSDGAFCISVDNLGFVYVTGNSNNTALNVDYTTIKYDKTTGIINTSNNIPERFELKQNYPNPFNPKTNLEFQISDFGFVSLKVFDIKGDEVANILNQNLTAGEYKIIFDASNLSSGIYYYQLKTDNFSETKKMILVK
jgi:uncharacterized delta-60 repeat protein